MQQLDGLKKRLSGREGLSKLSQADVDKLKSRFAGLPEEYTLFLEKVGVGDLGEIQLYGGPTSPKSVYPHPKDDLSHVVLFGDDFQGYCFGFDMTDGFSVVEVDPRGGVRPKESGFLALIESYISE